MSGLLQSSTVTYQGVPIYFNGRGDLGRTPVFSQTDLLIAHDFRIGGSKTIGLQANITNLFDQETVTGLSAAAYRDALVIPGFASRPADAFFQPGGFDTVAHPGGTGSRLRDGRHRPTTRRTGSRAHARFASWRRLSF